MRCLADSSAIRYVFGRLLADIVSHVLSRVNPVYFPLVILKREFMATVWCQIDTKKILLLAHGVSFFHQLCEAMLLVRISHCSFLFSGHTTSNLQDSDQWGECFQWDECGKGTSPNGIGV